MKLTPVKLYTVNYHGSTELGEYVTAFAETPEHAARQFAADHPKEGVQVIHVRDPDEEWTFRIDDGAAPAAGGWVKGPPPLDGQHYLARVEDDPALPLIVATKRKDGHGGYESAFGYHDADDITHHNPNPISLEIP